MPLVSVIVPVYNTENTLVRCVDSILNQSYDDFELILINDGSIDNCPVICDEYKNRDSRVRVIHKENGGVSSARNIGLEQARGMYVTFVDSDDYVELDYLREIVDMFQKSEADVVYMEYNRVIDVDGDKEKYSLPKLQNKFIDDVVKLSEEDMFGYTWIKAISRKFIGDTRFCEKLNLFEDEVFTCEIFRKEGKISCIHKPIYNYVQNPDSLSYRIRQDYYKNCEEVYHAWKEILPMKQEKYALFLQKKGKHMIKVCKYYGLEKKINPFLFFSELRKCDFIMEIDVNDPFIVDLKKGKIHRIWWQILKYRLINFYREMLR